MTFETLHGTLNVAGEAKRDNRMLVLEQAPSRINRILQSGLSYSPDSNYNGLDELTISLQSNGSYERRKVTIAITSVNDPPMIHIDAPLEGIGSVSLAPIRVEDVDCMERKAGYVALELIIEQGSIHGEEVPTVAPRLTVG